MCIVCCTETPSLYVYVHVKYVKTELILWYFYLEAACPKSFQFLLQTDFVHVIISPMYCNGFFFFSPLKCTGF